MASSLFGKNIEPACKYCVNLMQLTPSGNDALCGRLGIVSADFHCRRYKYDPLKRIPKATPPLQQFSSEDFSLEEPVTDTSGQVD